MSLRTPTARLVKRLTDIIIEAKENYPNARNRLDHISMMDSETMARVVEHNIPTNATPMFTNELDAGPEGSVIYEYMERMSKLHFGQTVNVDVMREGEKKVLLVQLEEME